MSAVGERWDARKARLRERISRRVPRGMILYPFEVMVGLLALLIGLPFLLGATGPASLLAMVGHFAFHAWATALTLGGVTVLLGLQLPARPNPLILAAGLQLTGGSFAVYALAAVTVIGAASWTAVSAYGLLCTLALIRSMHFRRVVDIQKGAAQLHDEVAE